jgi:hypothetical protein
MTKTRKRISVDDIDDRELPGDADLERRAIAAYFRGSKSLDRMPDQPNSGLSGVNRIDGKSYVVLKNVNGVLAVYRVRSTGLLRRMIRWPAVLGGRD